MAPAVDKMVTSIQTGLDTTVDRLNYEVKGYIQKRKVSRFTWVAFAFLSAANFMSLVTFCAPGWGWTQEVAGMIKVAGEYHGLYGVWYVCWTDLEAQSVGMCNSWASLDDVAVPSWMPGFQAVSVLVVICGLAAFFVQMAYMCIPSANKNRCVLLSLVGVLTLTGAFTCAQWILFMVGFLRDAWYCCKPEMIREIVAYALNYCFIISCVCSGLYFLTAIIAILEWARDRKKQQQVDSLLANPERPEDN